LNATQLNQRLAEGQEMPLNTTLNTSGRGLWSRAVCEVRINRISLRYISDDFRHGELLVHFDTDTWDVDGQGLIYTDPVFILELRQALDGLGLASTTVDYSEAGMQGDDYVSLDVGQEFLKSWAERYAV
jgi:hypothetical protein